MRLVTRGDLDGVTSAVLITEMEDVDSIELIHPQDITDRKFEVTSNDIIVNLPYSSGCGMWFDHHEFTESNEKPVENLRGKHALAPSVARVIYNYYSQPALRKYEFLVKETDRFDSAQLDMEEVLNPEGVILLGFTIDSRSGIGGFRDYFKNVVEWLKEMPLEEVLLKPEVVQRVGLLKESNAAFLKVLKENSRRDSNVVVTDFRSLERIPVGNRFLIYTMFPYTNVSVRIQWGPKKEFVAVTLGHNIFSRTSRSNCGHICSDFGGGGHRGAAACLLKTETADQQITEIIKRLKYAG